MESKYIKILGIESVSIACVPSEETKKIKGEQYARPFVIPTPLEWTDITPINEDYISYTDWPDATNREKLIK